MEQGLQQDRKGAVDQLAGANFLILEDQFEVAELLEIAVQDAGGEVLAKVATVDDALALIRERRFSAAIITMIAGGIYTDMVARELSTHNIPFVVTTGIGTDPSHPELHASPTLIKPFQTSYLQAALAKLLGCTEIKPLS